MASGEAIVASWRGAIEEDCTAILRCINNTDEDLTGPSSITIEISIDASDPEILAEGMQEDDSRAPRVIAAVGTLLNGPMGSLVLAIQRAMRNTYELTPEGVSAVHRIDLYIDTQDRGNSATRFYARRVEGKMDEEENDE